MHVLIIGAAGMVGRKLVAALLAAGQVGGQTLSALTLADIVAPEAPATTVPVATLAADLSQPGVAENLVATRPDLIFHLAAIVSGEAEADFERAMPSISMAPACCSRRSGWRAGRAPIARAWSSPLRLRCSARRSRR